MIRYFIFILILCISSQVYSQQPVSTEAVPVKRYYYETARSAEKINAKYPYDISLKTPQGDSLLSSAVLAKGKPVVLLFWLTTCYPCRMEMDAISQKFEAWKKETDFELYAISTDFGQNFPAIQKRAADRKWPFALLWDYNREFKEILPGGLNGLPQVFVLDSKGEIAFHKRKYSSGDEDLLYEQVKQLAARK